MAADPTAEAKVHSPAFVVAVPAGHPDPTGKEATLPPDAPPVLPASPTVTLPPTPWPASDRDLPSFSSLVGMPGEAATTESPSDDVVPLGDQTVDFAPPLVPGYEIIREVGRGGMGVVYKARQLSLNRPVALKMILAGPHAGPQERDRFRREAEAVATLQNPHIVQIFEIGEANGHLYLALEYVDGGSLAQQLAGKPWQPETAAELVELLARAVHYAHDAGIVHRDLKPGNILLGTGEIGGRKAEDEQPGAASAVRSLPSAVQAKITDFGLAKRLGDTANPDGTKTGAVMGTPSYIAPEQASGKTRDVGPSVDVYSLGAILYELLTGRPPFLGETPLDTVLQVLHDDPVPPKRLQPNVPRDLETICLKCLNKSAAKRYPSASALADDLRRFLSGEPIKARPLSAWGRGLKWAKRHPSLASLGAITVAATIALVSVLTVAYARVRDAKMQKESEAAAAQLARDQENRERRRAEELARQNEEARQKAVDLAADIEKRRKEADERNEQLKREAERTRRAAFALQLAQVAAMCDRDPGRALGLLEDPVRCPPELRDFTWAYLRRLCQREERLYSDHHNDPLRAVAFSPSGTLVATAGEAGQVRVWDPRTGRTWAILTGHESRILGVAFSPDGGAIATAGADHSVRLWELPVRMLDDARSIAPFIPGAQGFLKPLLLEPDITLNDAHEGQVNCVAFSPDGRLLASGGEDGKIRLWELSGWRTTNPTTGAVGGVGSTASLFLYSRFAPDARPVWTIRTVDAHDGGVRCLAFSANGNLLVSGGNDREVRVWTRDGTSLVRSLGTHADAVLALAVSPDGKTVATANNGATPTIRIINAETSRDIRRLTGHRSAIYALAISREGDLLASAGFDHTVRLWDLEDGKERGVFQGHEQRVSGLAFSPDRRVLLSGSTDTTARLWQTTMRPNDGAEMVREVSLTSAAISGSGTTFVGGDEAGRMHVLRSDAFPTRPGSGPGGQFLVLPIPLSPPPRGPITATAASPDGKLVLASTNEAIYVWRILQFGRRPMPGPPLALNRPVPIQVPRAVYAMAVDPTGRWLLTLDSEGVRMWDLESLPAAVDRPDRRVTLDGPGLILPIAGARALTFNPAGDRIAIAVGKDIRIIDRKGHVLVSQPDAHTSEVEAIAFGGKHGELFASADDSGIVQVWRVGVSGVLTHQAELVGHTGKVYSVAFTPDGRTLATGGFDRAVLLWDPVTGQERAVLSGHADRVLRVQFLPDSSGLVSFGRDGSVKRWRADDGKPAPTTVRSPPQPVPSGW